MKKFLAGLCMALGCAGSNAALLQLELSGSVRHYEDSAFNPVQAKVDRPMSISITVNTAHGHPVSQIDPGFSINARTSEAGCAAVYGTTCSLLIPGADVIVDYRVTIDGNSYGPLSGALFRPYASATVSKIFSPATDQAEFSISHVQDTLDAAGTILQSRTVQSLTFVSADYGLHPGWLTDLMDLTVWPSASAFLANDNLVSFGITTNECTQQDPTSCRTTEDSFRSFMSLTDFSMTVLPVSEVPEPGSLALAGAGLLGLVAMRRRGKLPH